MTLFFRRHLIKRSTNNRLKNDEMTYAVLFWLWLGMILFGSIIFSVDFSYMGTIKKYVSTVLLLWPLALIRSNVIIYHCNRLNIFSVLFMSSIVLSSIYSNDPITIIVMGLLTIFSFYISYFFVIKTKGVIFSYSYIFVAISTLAILYYVYKGDPSQVRMEGFLNPNSLAMYAVSGALMAIFIKNRFLAIIFFYFFFLIILSSGSRTSLIALCIGTLIYIALKFKNPSNYQVSLFFFASTIFLVFLLQYYYFVWQSISHALALDDSYRGLGTGFTGRDIAWVEAWNIFIDNPFFGVGYRSHESLMTTQSSAHNGYLATLAELGLFGSIILIFSSYIAFYKLVHMPSTIKAFHLPIIVSYLFICFFERYFFNLANPLSLLFIYSFIFCFVSNPIDNVKFREIKIK